MKGKIFQFETLEQKFLRKTSKLLDSLKASFNSKDINIAYLEELKILCATYKGCLPIKYNELLHLLSLICLLEDVDNISQSDFLHDAILLCKLINQAPSIDVFIELALNDFDFVCSQFEFSERTIISILDYLEYIQNNCNLSDITTPITYLSFPKHLSPELKKYTFTPQQFYKLWCALGNLTISDELMIRIIKSSKLSDTYFIDFVTNILLLYGKNEIVISELINCIQETKIYKSRNKDKYVKVQLYTTILSSPNVPESIVKIIIPIIELNLDFYYDFFYELLKNYQKNDEIRNMIIERLSTDIKKLSESFKPHIMRLQLLATN